MLFCFMTEEWHFKQKLLLWPLYHMLNFNATPWDINVFLII